jgi:hypothetical protein
LKFSSFYQRVVHEAFMNVRVANHCAELNLYSVLKSLLIANVEFEKLEVLVRVLCYMKFMCFQLFEKPIILVISWRGSMWIGLWDFSSKNPKPSDSFLSKWEDPSNRIDDSFPLLWWEERSFHGQPWIWHTPNRSPPLHES